MDFEADLGGSVGPYRELFADVQDIIHPLKFSSGIQFAFSTPLNAAFGIIHTLKFPNSSEDNEALANRVASSASISARRTYALGAYLIHKFADPVRKPRLVVSAETTTDGLSVASADFREKAISARGAVLLARNHVVDLGLSTDYRGPDFTATAKGALDGSAYFAYHQRLGSFGIFNRLTAGGEVLVSDVLGKVSQVPTVDSGPSRLPGLSVGFAGCYTDDDHKVVVTTKKIRMGTPATDILYTHNITEHVKAVAAIEHNPADNDVVTSIGYRTRFPRTRSVFTGSVASSGMVRAEYERRLLSNVRGTLLVDYVMWPTATRNPGFEVGLKVAVGPQPVAPLELSGLLMRDGPRAWQK